MLERGLEQVNAEQASEDGLVLNEREQQWEKQRQKMIEAGKFTSDSDAFLNSPSAL